VQQLESKVGQLETRARLSEEKAKKMEAMLNHKLNELTRMQNTFSQQNKVG
jgi:ribosomal protein L16 Arg81 hydroxylase